MNILLHNINIIGFYFLVEFLRSLPIFKVYETITLLATLIEKR